MQLFPRVVISALLGWQAAVSLVGACNRVTDGPNVDWSLALSGDTTARMERVLGADAAIYLTLQQVIPPGTTVYNRKVQGSIEELRRTTNSEEELRAAFERLSARNGLFLQLSTLLFPNPFFVDVMDPIALVESEVAAGRQPWLFVLAPDPEPTARSGWTCCHRTERCRLWRFQKA